VPNLTSPDGPPSFEQEILSLASDPGVKALAYRCTGDWYLAEDAIQEAQYAMLRLKNPERITNRRAYFCKVVTRAGIRMRSVPGTVSLDDLETGPEGPRVSVAVSPSFDDAAVSDLTIQTWLARLAAGRERYEARVPGRSSEPDRYRTKIVEATIWLLKAVSNGADQKALNETLRSAYPEWFADSECDANLLYQRLSRARTDVQRLLQEIVTRDELIP
jgi:Sigma-70 region 2